MPPPTRPPPHNRPCPCHSGRTYGECCAVYHRGDTEAPTPESLMRSRFTAFAIGNVPYLYRTLDASHEDRQRPADAVQRDMRDACNSFRYMGLHVLDRRDADAEGIALVLFIARLFERGTDRSFVELSRFRHDGVGWRYISGDIAPARPFGPDATKLTIDAFRARAAR